MWNTGKYSWTKISSSKPLTCWPLPTNTPTDFPSVRLNNPTGNRLCREENYYPAPTHLKDWLFWMRHTQDFSNEASFLQQLDEFPNLIILQTFSKAWGCAGIRLGMAFASQEIINLLN